MRYALWFRSIALYIVLVLAVPLQVFSQDGNGNESGQEAQQRFSQEELAQMLAPIALYPDALLAQVLIASTYPLEIVAADRWVEQNKDLKGDDLAKALEEQNWDPSVKSLVNFPTVLSMMSRKLEITAKLGDAFLAQEKEVMETVQMLRKKAMAAGNLKSTKEQNVVVEQETVVIEPVEREVVYVPTYDPLWVYGPWFYPAYPPYPYYYYPPPYAYIGFATAITLGFAWGYAWGGCNWHHHSVYVDVYRPYYVTNRYINRDRYVRYYERRGVIDRDGQGRWRHDPSHRRGVAYRDPRTAERFGQSPARTMRSRDARGGFEDRSRGRVDGTVRQPVGRPGVEQKGRTAPTRGEVIQAPSREQRGSAGAERRGGRESLPAGVSGQVAPKRESAFSGVQRDGGAAARSASERGRASREWSGGGRSGGFGSGGRFEGSGGRSGGWTGGGTGGRSGGWTGGGSGGRSGGGTGGRSGGGGGGGGGGRR